MGKRFLSFVLMAVAFPAQLPSQERRAALTIRQVESLVSDLPDARLAEEIRSRGIDRPITSSDLQRLRVAGAGSNTQSALVKFFVRSPLTVTVNPMVRDTRVTVDDHNAVTDSDGRVTIDGLAPGAHLLVVEKPPAHPRIEQRIVLAEGGSMVRVSLRTATGKVTVTTDNREARIEIRDRGTFSLPLRDFELPAGTYAVIITAPMYVR